MESPITDRTPIVRSRRRADAGDARDRRVNNSATLQSEQDIVVHCARFEFVNDRWQPVPEPKPLRRLRGRFSGRGRVFEPDAGVPPASKN